MNNNKHTILITGAGGQLGLAFRDLADRFPQFIFIFASKGELQITDYTTVTNYFDLYNINTCINCAAYTAVDKAEKEKEKAFAVNANAVGNLAMICKRHKVQLIHFSTDYVFDGKADHPYRETDETDPVNTYGASKLKGEELAIQFNPSTIIIRSSWVYSEFGNNFVKTMLRLLIEKESIHVVNDQRGCPTYAADLAKAVMKIVESVPETNYSSPALFNYCNSGNTTWYDFALAIKEITGSKCIINPILTADYSTPARRPHYSILDTSKIRENFQLNIPDWQQSLHQCIDHLLKNKLK